MVQVLIDSFGDFHQIGGVRVLVNEESQQMKLDPPFEIQWMNPQKDFALVEPGCSDAALKSREGNDTYVESYGGLLLLSVSLFSVLRARKNRAAYRYLSD
jgi:hypothetical protein